MRKFRYILFLGYILQCYCINGQHIVVINTKDLINSTKTLSLDSILEITHKLPFYYLDSVTAKQLTNFALLNSHSDNIKNFLIKYSLNFYDSQINKILFNYYKGELNKIRYYIPQEYGGLPKYENDELLGLIRFSNDSIASLLIDYYNEWDKLSQKFKTNYDNGLSEPDKREQEKLMLPFQDCKLNCYKLLLALDRLNSPFFDTTKLSNCNKYLKSYNKNSNLYLQGDIIDFKTKSAATVHNLSKRYNSIGEIDIKKEKTLRELYGHYDGIDCWRYVMYNNQVGYFDFGCQTDVEAGSGEIYFVELKDGNKLIIYLISSWIS